MSGDSQNGHPGFLDVPVPVTRLSSSALLLAALLAFTPQSFAQDIEPTDPRLVLVLSIDQMRYDYLARFDDLYEGGFRTLIDAGAVFTNARYRHAVTETGPGHAVILSGRHPSSSGIIGNSWYDRLLGRTINVVDDPFQAVLGGAGRQASPANFVGFTLGDVLKQSHPNSKVVGVSLKDRSAILMTGRSGDAAYWYETVAGEFVTSTYYVEKAPDWLLRWNRRRVADRYARALWSRLLDPVVYEQYAGPDRIDGEWDREDTVFPHRIRGNPPDPGFYNDLRRTPYADEMTLEVAVRAMREHDLGRDGNTDILAIGFSGTDIIGHTYGPDSQELMDQMLRLDLLLAKLLEEVDDRVGLDETLVVLTADHGAMPLVENLQVDGVDAARVDPQVLVDAVIEALIEAFPDPSGFIQLFGLRTIYLNTVVIADRGVRRADVEEVVTRALLETGLVADVYNVEQLTGTDPPNDPYLQLYRNSYFSSRSPELMIRFKEYLYFSRTFLGGTGHGTPYDYDRHVPIVLMGEGVRPGSYPDPSGPEDIAPTLAALLGLEYPREHDARILAEALH